MPSGLESEPSEHESATGITSQVDLPRKISFVGAVAVMVGVIIGSGIFGAPTEIAQNLGDPYLILALWVAGGIIALCGAMTFAELGSMLPRSGGIYVYLREGFGDCPAFVFGWTYLLITKPAAAGGIAIVFAEHFNTLLGVHWDSRITTCACLLVLTIVNVLGVRGSARLAIAMTSFKYAAIAAIILLGIFAAIREVLAPGTTHVGFERVPSPKPFMAAIVPVMAAILWTYDGWADVAAIAGEVKEPQKNLPRVFILGTLSVILLYVLANAVYLWHISLPAMAGTKTVAPLLLNKLIGPIGSTLMSVIIICSTVGSSHSSILTGARVTFAQAQDGLLFRVLGRVSPRFQTPAVSLWTEFALSCVAIWMLGTFASLIGSFVFTMWIFYGMAALAVFVLRRRLRETFRPFRVPGYPYVPAIFVLASATMTVLSIRDDPKITGIWLGVLAAGVPVYFVWRWMFPTAIGMTNDEIRMTNQ